MKKKFNALIVGFGYWGPILARNFQNSSQFEVYAVCDSNNPNLNRGKNIYPNSEYYYKTKISLPLFYDISKIEQNFIINKISNFIRGSR